MSKSAFKRVNSALGFERSRQPLPAFAWPGGYPIVYLCHDGECLCPDCVNKEIERVDDEMRHPAPGDQFRVFAAECHYEGAPIICANCNAEIESAYGDPDAQAETTETGLGALADSAG